MRKHRLKSPRKKIVGTKIIKPKKRKRKKPIEKKANTGCGSCRRKKKNG